jgi:hypothetical protein
MFGNHARMRLLRTDSIVGWDSATETHDVSATLDSDQGFLGINASWIGWTQRPLSMS